MYFDEAFSEFHPINTTVDSPKPSVGKKLTKNRQLVKKWGVNQK
jgi:hypothetical protein